jgi:hypothetical protein
MKVILNFRFAIFDLGHEKRGRMPGAMIRVAPASGGPIRRPPNCAPRLPAGSIAPNQGKSDQIKPKNNFLRLTLPKSAQKLGAETPQVRPACRTGWLQNLFLASSIPGFLIKSGFRSGLGAHQTPASPRRSGLVRLTPTNFFLHDSAVKNRFSVGLDSSETPVKPLSVRFRRSASKEFF